MVHGSWFMVQGSEFRVQGSRFRVQLDVQEQKTCDDLSFLATISLGYRSCSSSPSTSSVPPLPASRTVQLTIREQLLRSNEKQFQGGLVLKARRLFVSLNSRPRVIKKRERRRHCPRPAVAARGFYMQRL